MTTVTITFLHMLSPGELRSKASPRPGLAIVRVPRPMPELNRFFYTAIGGDWFWLDRLPWTYADWQRYLGRPQMQTWLITEAGVPVGYFELEQQGPDTEIVYFGLLASSAEQGIGGWALSRAAETAWAAGAERVWVHTCDLDHPRALANYLARGFRIYKTETKEVELPAQSPGPWPGSR